MLERVTLVKGVRLGFTTLLTGAIGGYVANEHAAILALLPTDSDARDYVVSELEPIFSAHRPCGLASDSDEGGRATRSPRHALRTARCASLRPGHRATSAASPPASC